MKITLRDLARKHNQNYIRLFAWVKRGWLPAKREWVEVERRYSKTGKVAKQKYLAWVVDENDWLEIPTFIRDEYRKRTPKRNTKS